MPNKKLPWIDYYKMSYKKVSCPAIESVWMWNRSGDKTKLVLEPSGQALVQSPFSYVYYFALIGLVWTKWSGMSNMIGALRE